eukprot:scaffold1552_cov144-Isochrysis_galbana.AAC.10
MHPAHRVQPCTHHRTTGSPRPCTGSQAPAHRHLWNNLDDFYSSELALALVWPPHRSPRSSLMHSAGGAF